MYAIVSTVKTGINGPCARTLDLPLIVRSGVFLFFFLSRGGRFLAPFPEEEISGNIAHGPFIRVFTVGSFKQISGTSTRRTISQRQAILGYLMVFVLEFFG